MGKLAGAARLETPAAGTLLPDATLRQVTLALAVLAAVLVTLVVSLWATGAFDTPSLRTPTPPGWTAHPQDLKPGWTSVMCFGSACYHVDGQGHPYGRPFGSQPA